MYKRPAILPRSHILRPQKNLIKKSLWDTALTRVLMLLNRWRFGRLSSYQSTLSLIKGYAISFSIENDKQLLLQGRHLGAALRRSEFDTRLVAQTFALVREVSGRQLGMRHFDTQLLGGLALFFGNITEMQTGEGKTLTATLPAATAALAGVPVHVITVNDYLAKRDCDEMRTVYEALGLSVGCVVQGMSHDERKAVYACDIVYCTNKELVFDYLKDQIEIDKGRHALQLHAQRLKGAEAVAEKILIKGLHFAIIDEVDSVLMDEAITPLIISATVPENERESEVYQQALAIAETLVEKTHFDVDYVKRSISLLQAGEQLAKEQAVSLGPFWRGRVRRIELVSKALSALFLFHKDEQYLLRDNKVQIIDQHTGRVMPDRTWEKGLHQLIEFKEGCELTKPRVTLEKISYQRFFRFYHHIAGMTGTAREVEKEFWSIYQLPVITIPSYRKNRRYSFKAKVCHSIDDKWPLIANAVSDVLDQGRAVLVGTGSVASSERLSAELTEQGICHQLLNAKQDEDEADIIAAAGQSGAVTIATSMAGRGTDIKLDDSVAQAGGLHVILTELQESSRIDRQLEGRCARMGDNGSVERIVSVEDAITENLSNIWFQLAARIPQQHKLNKIISMQLLRMAQKTLEKRHLKLRSTLLKIDERQDELLAFAGQRI